MKILFQGDSITDAGRDRDDIHNLGSGYAKFAAELIKNEYPQSDFEFINLGISGNRTESLVERLESDFIDINPDVVSILIGINDTWHSYSENGKHCPIDYFESNYRNILIEIKTKTNAKILMLEPFLLGVADKEHFHEDLDPKIQVIRKLAREFADVFIPLDGLFAAESVGNSPEYFAHDGIHPTIEGAKFIAEHYLAAFKKVFNK